MSYEAKDNTGSLWQNDKKEKDSHPDRTGSITVDGKDYWINGWLKKTQEGKPWLSLSVKPKQQQAAQQPPARTQQRPAPRHDEEPPF